MNSKPILFYDTRDDALHEARGSKILYWLDDLDAQPLSEARPEQPGFLFTGARSIDDYRNLSKNLPLLRDRSNQREPLLRLDSVLDRLKERGIDLPTPRTWRLPVDQSISDDLTYPLFVRTAASSLKLGGRASRVRSPDELEAEMADMRRLLGWDSLILARGWCDFAEAGSGVYGPVPQEVRVWIVDGQPYAWSFHYLNVLPAPKGFPPSNADLQVLAGMARQIGSAFGSRCIAADFARDLKGAWVFIEAGPGSCAGTAHEQVFKAVATRLQGSKPAFQLDHVGGLFD